MRDRIFLSYSHDDKEWKDRFVNALKPAQLWGRIDLWDDERISPGSDWYKKIKSSIQSSRVALLLVSGNFLSSEFIAVKEFPLLEAQQKQGLSIRWVPLEIPPSFIHPFFQTAQACWPTNRPLKMLSREEYEAAIKQICDDLVAKIPRLSPKQRLTLKDKVQRNIGNIRIDSALGSGDLSTVFVGTQPGRKVAIKVLDATPSNTKAVLHFREAVRTAIKLQNPVFISIYDYGPLSKRPPAFVREYVDGETLEHMIERRKRLEVRDVARIARLIAEAFSEAHEHGLIYGNLKSSDVLMINDQRGPFPRISAIAFAESVRKTSSYGYGNADLGGDKLNLLIPEQYFGWKLDSKSDQYSLALLICEMLDGKIPAAVRYLVDLEQRRRFFNRPYKFLGSWKEDYPQFASIILRMLCKVPKQRYAGMDEVVNELQHLPSDAISSKSTATLAYAYQIYEEIMRRDIDKFMREFYDSFHALCEQAKLRNPFKDDDGKDSVEWPRLYRMVNNAIRDLLDYARSRDPSLLEYHAGLHVKKVQAQPEHFDIFGTALRETLQRNGAQEGPALTSWDTAIAPGIEFMRNTCSVAPMNGRKGQTKEVEKELMAPR